MIKTRYKIFFLNRSSTVESENRNSNYYDRQPYRYVLDSPESFTLSGYFDSHDEALHAIAGHSDSNFKDFTILPFYSVDYKGIINNSED